MCTVKNCFILCDCFILFPDLQMTYSKCVRHKVILQEMLLNKIQFSKLSFCGGQLWSTLMLVVVSFGLLFMSL